MHPSTLIALDTNVLVRYLAQDDALQSALATQLIEQTLDANQPGFVSLVALLETVWVMESCYSADARTVAGILQDMLNTRSLEVQDKAAVRVATQRYAQGSVDLHDCLIVALARQRQARVVTFDAKAARRLGMTLLA
jgi:predicted nucleic-acid-binding protein